MNDTFQIAFFVGLSLIGAILGIIETIFSRRKDKDVLENALKKTQESPEKAKPAWDLAQVTLNSYYQKNLQQITAIFVLTVIVMLVGFGIIIWGVSASITSESNTLPAIISTISGIITEFIGATFLAMYKSTIKQAADYMTVLTKTSSVGIAMQILDTIDENGNESSVKTQTKVKVVEKLMDQASSKGEDCFIQ